MPMLDKHCFCCISLRKGALVSSTLFLLVSAATALLYVWGLLLLTQRGNDFRAGDEAYYQTVLALFYVLIGLHGIVMILASIISFIGAFCYSAGSSAFFSVILTIGTIVELGCVIFVGAITETKLNTGLAQEPYILGLVIWYVVRALWNIHLIIASWSLFQYFNSKAGMANQRR